MLERDRDLAALARQEHQRGGEAAPGALAGDDNSVAVDAQAVRMRIEPGEARIAVLDRPRIRRLRCEAVVDRDDHGVERLRVSCVGLARHVGRAEHITAAVDMQDARPA